MKFGKLSDITGVDFSLPPMDEEGMKFLGNRPSPQFEVFVGLPRWASKDWENHLFPKGTKAAEYLSYYAHSFNTIELNTTHYRIPKPEQVQKWRDLATENFVFCPKIPQSISHYRKLLNIEKELAQFTDSIREFSSKYGCSFIQLHESFDPKLYRNLEEFLNLWPRDLPLAIEFRHTDWFEYQALRPEALDLLRQYGVSPVITDVAGRRDVCHNSFATKTAMLRFVGNALDSTDFVRTDAWMDRLDIWVKNGLEKLYIFAHEPGDVMAMELGKYWIEQLNQRFDLNLAIPGIHQNQGDQMSLF